jgi:hypothetical protein
VATLLARVCMLKVCVLAAHARLHNQQGFCYNFSTGLQIGQLGQKLPGWPGRLVAKLAG